MNRPAVPNVSAAGPFIPAMTTDTNMKAVMYLSQSTNPGEEVWLPADLQNILTVARPTNRKHGVTGVLSYKKGWYLQIIEGPVQAIDNLWQNIKVDPRHEYVHAIAEIDISTRYFKEWDLKLIPFCEVDTCFVQFINDQVRGKYEFSPIIRQVFSKFYSLHKLETSEQKQPLKPESQEYQLNRWPNFVEQEPTRELLTLCGLLSDNKWMNTNDLMAESGDMEYALLMQHLVMLNQTGVLNCRTAKRPVPAYMRPVSSEGGSERHADKRTNFYQRMKQFLTASRSL